MKNILKLSLVFSVLAMFFVGCSRDSDGDSNSESEGNYPKPTATAGGITVETLSVTKTSKQSGQYTLEVARIEFKVSGKREPGTRNTYPYIVYGVKNASRGGYESAFFLIEDPNGSSYTVTRDVTVSYTYDKLDFSDIQVHIGQSDYFNNKK